MTKTKYQYRPAHAASFACVLAVLGGGCLSAEFVDSPSMCSIDADCEGSEICDEGVCWGDPPAGGNFAALLMPPSDRPDLAPTELGTLSISADGFISGLEFGPTIQLHGRIVLGCGDGVEPGENCGPEALVPGQVIVERLSSFPGGPSYRRTVLTNVEADIDEDSFRVSLPHDGEEYQVTVLPDEATINALASGSPQVQAPPFSTIIRTTDDLLVEPLKACMSLPRDDGAVRQRPLVPRLL
jgi:hypothetical protein